MAAASSRDAPQPAGKAFQFRVCSFNVGFDQGMMTSKIAAKHSRQFVRVVAKIVDLGDCDLFFASEVGGFGQGFRTAQIDVRELLIGPFGEGVGHAETGPYLAVWGFGGASQPARVSLHGTAENFKIPFAREVHAAITRFDVATRDFGNFHVVVGNMHIVSSKNPPTIPTRQRAVRLLREHLESLGADGDTRVVRIMVGDDNLKSLEARQALQQKTDAEPLWEVYAAVADRNGDHVAVNGADACFRPIAVGASFNNRGLHNDAHDAVAVVITVRGASQPAETKKRKVAPREEQEHKGTGSQPSAPAPLPFDPWTLLDPVSENEAGGHMEDPNDGGQEQKSQEMRRRTCVLL